MNNFIIIQCILDLVFIAFMVLILPDYLNLKLTVKFLKEDLNDEGVYTIESDDIYENDINIKPVEIEEELPKIDISDFIDKMEEKAIDTLNIEEPKKKSIKRKKYKDKYIIGDYIKSLQEMSDYVNDYNLVLYDTNLHKFLKIKYITEKWGDWILHFENGHSSIFTTYVYKKCKRKDGLKEVNYG